MDLIKYFSTAQSMASLARYSQTRLVAPESVLQHSGFVVLTSYFIGLELNSVADDSNKLPMDELLSKAIVHDLDEIAVGDIARPTKYHNNETIAMFDKLKVIGIKKVVQDLYLEPPTRDKVLYHHAASKEGRTGFIVDLADKCAVVYKLWDECLLRHNYTLLRQAVHLRDRGFLETLQAHITKHGFNKEQAFYLHAFISNMKEVLGMVAAKKCNVHGIMNEALGCP